MAVSIALAAVGAGLAIYGAVKKSQAEKRAKQNIANRPKYAPIPEDTSELDLAEQQANIGMGAAARQQLNTNTDRALATTTSAALMGGGDANAIGSIVDRSQNTYNQTALYDDQVRQGHLNTLMKTYAGYNSQRRGDADKQFQVNQYGPWADRQQLYASQVAGGQQTMNSGINLFAKGATGALSGMGQGGDSGMGDTGSQMAGGGGTGSSGGSEASFGNTPGTGSSGGWGGGAATGDSGGWQGYYQPEEFTGKKSMAMVPYYDNQ